LKLKLQKITSLFAFDQKGELVSTKLENHKFVSLLFNAPNPQYTKKIDLVEEFPGNLPKEE
jgi:hypothetical protein